MLRRWLLMVMVGLAVCGSPRPAPAAEYMIQAEDVLNVRVAGEPKLTMNYPVSEQGEITMEQLGKVKVAGLTAKQAQKKLTEGLDKFLNRFEVAVDVVSETGSRVLVYGEVKTPGEVKLRRGARILDALALAGSPTPGADTKHITLAHREGKPQTIDLDAVAKDPSLNVELASGDTIHVPGKTSRSVRIDGEVADPGAKSLEDAKTAYAAIRLAKPTDRVDWKRVALRRNGSEVPVMIDLSNARTGLPKDDFPLQEGDQLTVHSKFSGTAKLDGYINKPGEVDLTGPTRLLDLIISAGGGFTPEADRRRVQVYRDGKLADTQDLLAVQNGTRRSDDQALEVQPGDRIFVTGGTATLRGEVTTPGSKPIGTASNIWDFILTQGGGFKSSADQTNVEIRRGGKIVRTLNVEDVAKGKSTLSEEELEVRAGDEVIVHSDEAKRFGITGGVEKPGAYVATADMTLLQALGLAGKLSERADTRHITVVPKESLGPDGRLKVPATETSGKARKGKRKQVDRDNRDNTPAAAPQEGTPPSDLKDEDAEKYGLKVVDLEKLTKGDASQNVIIKAGDQIYVPEKPAQGQKRKGSFLRGVLQMVPLAGLLLRGGF